MQQLNDKDLARGKWRAILAELGGLTSEQLNGKHQPCPICGGKDRFRFTDKNRDGMFYCSGDCGSGDGFKLLCGVRGWTFAEAAKEVRRVASNASETPAEAPFDMERHRAKMQAILDRCRPVEPTSPAGKYLKRRGLECFASDRINFLFDIGRCQLVAPITSHEGELINLHITRLTEHGEKANVDNPKSLLRGPFYEGASVRLMPYRLDRLGIAEGIETALSASRLFNVPVWAALNSVRLATWKPPHDVREVFVFGDNDASYTGQADAYRLARRLTHDGIKCHVELPLIRFDMDWNDVLLGNGDDRAKARSGALRASQLYGEGSQSGLHGPA